MDDDLKLKFLSALKAREHNLEKMALETILVDLKDAARGIPGDLMELLANGGSITVKTVNITGEGIYILVDIGNNRAISTNTKTLDMRPGRYRMSLIFERMEAEAR